MAEQIATRFQQENQFARSLDLDHTRLSIQSQLETRAMDLQEKGLHMEDAFRRAELEVSTQIETRALDLQELGLNMEDAYRYAALEQDGNFRQQALNLEAHGLNMEAAFRGAETVVSRLGLASGTHPRPDPDSGGFAARGARQSCIARWPAGSTSIRSLIPGLGRVPIPEVTPPPGTPTVPGVDSRRQQLPPEAGHPPPFDGPPQTVPGAVQVVRKRKRRREDAGATACATEL